MSFEVRDTEFITTKALPNGAATVNSDGLDLRAMSSRGVRPGACELKISAPALDTNDLPDTKTMKYDVECDEDSGFGSPKTLAKEVLVQTGSGGAGAAAATARYRLPSDTERYIRVNATNDGTGDASDKSMTVEVLF